MWALSERLIWLAGGKPEVLQKCPGERRKLAAMGALVAVTGGFAFFAALFSLTNFMHVFMPLAALLAVGWSLAIMSLDRYFVMAIRRDTSRGRTVLLTLPRVAIAVIAGAVVATPITLWLFGAEVTRLAEEEKVQSIRTGQLLLSRKYAEVPEARKACPGPRHRRRRRRVEPWFEQRLLISAAGIGTPSGTGTGRMGSRLGRARRLRRYPPRGSRTDLRGKATRRRKAWRRSACCRAEGERTARLDPQRRTAEGERNSRLRQPRTRLPRISSRTTAKGTSRGRERDRGLAESSDRAG